MERWSPDLEEGYRQGMKAGLEMREDSGGWRVVGLVASGCSGFVIGVVVGVVLMLILK